MPSYAWVCFACQKSNASGTEVCVQCGMSANATGRQIAAATANRVASSTPATGSAEPLTHGQPGSKQPPLFAAPLLFLFGVLCLVGAVMSFTNSRWPAFMPPQLDMVAVPLSWLSEKLGAWVGGAVATLVGVLSILAGSFAASRNGAG
jgi:hypothetical protein